jgi:hypothetical protein
MLAIPSALRTEFEELFTIGFRMRLVTCDLRMCVCDP